MHHLSLASVGAYATKLPGGTLHTEPVDAKVGSLRCKPSHAACMCVPFHYDFVLWVSESKLHTTSSHTLMLSLFTQMILYAKWQSHVLAVMRYLPHYYRQSYCEKVILIRGRMVQWEEHRLKSNTR